MEGQNRGLAIVCFLCFGLGVLCQGQEASRKASAPQAQGAPTGKSVTVMSPEEKLVRAAYEKLTMLNKAARLNHGGGAANDSPEDSQVLRFELSNFRVGPIQEIWGALYSEMKTLPSGEIIMLARSITTLNKGPEHVAYEAEWTQGQYASMYDRQWTVGDLFGWEPDRYHDVGGYASYEVTVYYRGKSRTYRALALFHNPYGSVENLKPDFWDTVVGMGGTLTDVWKEKRPPVNEKVSPPVKRGAPSAAPDVSPPPESFAQDSDGYVAYDPESDTALSSMGGVVQSKTEDSREHTSGAHGQEVGFQGSCTAQSSNEQLCRVEFASIYTYENGTTKNWVYTHVNRIDEKQETGTGPRGMAISCTAARGVATSNCLNPECTFSASLQGSGTSVTMSGGDVWNGQLAHRHTCNLPSAPGGGGGSCDLSLATSASPTAESDSVSTNIAPGGGGGCGCDEVQRMDCFNGGGEWSETYCSCVSPLVIDVDGDGFDLTDGAGGVDFDFTGDGTPERLAWTSAGSDDAWLVLDRNGNGLVDSGQELFGTHTPQPAPQSGERRNGFVALAVYDRTGEGGNADGVIDARDAIFGSLRLWQDTNHNGVSEAGELSTLPALEVVRIDLDYRESQRSDEHGNRFRYRAKVSDARGARVGRWAWDVFPVRAQ